MQVTGESVRDKHKRELAQRKQVLKEGRKQTAKVNTTSLAGESMLRRRVGKINSNHRVSDNKGSAAKDKDGVGISVDEKKTVNKR